MITGAFLVMLAGSLGAVVILGRGAADIGLTPALVAPACGMNHEPGSTQ